jgi:hypothetical protein
VRIPTFSRQTDSADTADTDQPVAVGTPATPVRPQRDGDDTTVTNLPPAPSVTPPPANPPTATLPPAPARRTETARAADVDRTDDLRKPVVKEPVTKEPVVAVPVVPAGPKPRASLLATLGLVLGVASALLVLSGPLLGYGIGVAVLALILSLGGVHATGQRHVAGKSDALLGMVLSLAAIVVGVLALTGSLSWLGTDMQPVSTFRQWLDAQFVHRF